MFETRDGKIIKLHDTIYVIDLARKVNKLGRVFTSTKRNYTDVVIYAMEVTEKHEYVSYVYDKSISDYVNVDAWTVTGSAWFADHSKPVIGQHSSTTRFYNGIIAAALNTFSTIEAARNALYEFKRRGLVITSHGGVFADAYFSDMQQVV